jgi:hypothetical protein
MKVGKQLPVVRTLCLALVIGVLLDHGARAQEMHRVSITEFGIYKAHVEETIDAPGAATGVTHTLSDIDLVESTVIIPARLDVRFGFRYRIVGPGKSVKVKRVVHFPEPGLRMPDNGNAILTSGSSFDRRIGDVHFFGYHIDYDWEILPGTWTLELWINDRKVASKSFELVRE